MRGALYNDTCRGCGDAIAKGDEIHWTQADGPRCTDCGPAQPDEKRGAATGIEDAPGYVRVLSDRIDAQDKKIEELEGRLTTQYGDFVALQAWAVKLSADLDVPGPEVPE